MSESLQVDAGRMVDVETEVRTFLIADVRGYTRFTLERGDAEAARLAAQFAELVRKGVKERGGDVIELRGDEVLVAFASTRQALRAGVDLQAAFVARSQADPSLPLRVGMGIDAGEAIPVEGGYRGAALNLAARLCGLAAAGEILTTETVTNLARKVEGVEYAERGTASLKGFADPVKVIQVKAVDAVQPVLEPDALGLSRIEPRGGYQRLPIGGFMGSLPSNPLVARSTELQDLDSRIDAVIGSEGRAVLLAGEPGAGKTRLAQEITLHARNRGFLIAAGRCYEAEGTIPYYPFLDALAGAYAAAPYELQRLVAQRWPYLGALLPDQVGVPEVVGGQDEQQRLFRAVTGFLEAIATEVPVALLLDDLHWADSASLKLLLHLVRHTRSSRVLIVGAYRDVEVGRLHPLEDALRELGREGLMDRVAVRRLDQEGTASLMATTMGQDDISDEFAQLVHERTEGNPFFVQQVMRVLVERGDIYREDGRWLRKEVDAIEVPESVRSVVGQRLGRLSPETQVALREASVLGQTFSFDDLQEMTGKAEDEVERALEDAAGVGLVRTADGDAYGFDHALTQQSLYAEIAPRRRRKLHIAAGEALERLPEGKRKGRIHELAWHFLQGDDERRALRYSLLAAEAAEKVFAHTETEMHARTAAELAREVGDQRAELEALEVLARALDVLVRFDEELDVLESAASVTRALEDREGELRVTARLGRAHMERGTRQAGIARLEEVRERAAASPPSAGLAELYVALGTLHWGEGRSTEALPFIEQGIELAEAAGARHLLAYAEGRRALVLHWLAREDDALAAYQRTVALAEETNDLDTLLRALNNLNTWYAARGDWATARSYSERQIEIARRTDNLGILGFAFANLGNLAMESGDWDEAERWYAEARDVLAPLGPSRASFALIAAPHLRLLRTGDPEAECQLEALIDQAEQTGDDLLRASAEVALADWELLKGNAVAARARVESALAGDTYEGQHRVGAYLTLLRSSLQMGDLERAREVVRDLHGFAELDSEFGRRYMKQVDGLLASAEGRWSDAEALFESRLAEPQLSLPNKGVLLFDYGRMLGRMGERERASGRLEQAREIARHLGTQPYLDMIDREQARLDLNTSLPNH